MRVRTRWFDQRARLAQDADAPERVGGPEAHALRDEVFAEATRKPSNPSPSATNKRPRTGRGLFAFRYRIVYSSVFAKFIAAGMSGSSVTSGTTWM